MSRDHIKLFIPGPVEVSEKTLEAYASPMIGHRGKEFAKLYDEVQPGLKKLFYTQQPVFVATGSAWCVMEGALRNVVKKKVLCCMCGAFSDKWFDVAHANGKEAEGLQVEWGDPILPEKLDEKLATGEFDTVALIHNETSTGVMNPLKEIAEVVGKYEDVIFVVDCVSSFGGVKIEFDRLGIDVMLAGLQKAMALPPGATVFTVSEKAFKRAEGVTGRGYYMDFFEFLKNHEKSTTPTTPSIAHFFALKSKLGEIEEEGLEARYARHLENAELTRAWVRENGFEMFPRSGYQSVTLSCVKNTRGIDVEKWNGWLKQTHRCMINGGYGKIKGKTFRISHMGDEKPEDIRQLLGWLEEGLQKL